MDIEPCDAQTSGHGDQPQAYPSDISDEEWALVTPYLCLLPEEAGQRGHPLREVFNGLRHIIKTGAPWRWMANDLPSGTASPSFPPGDRLRRWAAVYQQAQRWLVSGCFEALADDLRAVLRLAAGRAEEPSAVIIDSRTLRSSPESGTRGGHDGGKRKKGSNSTSFDQLKPTNDGFWNCRARWL